MRLETDSSLGSAAGGFCGKRGCPGSEDDIRPRHRGVEAYLLRQAPAEIVLARSIERCINSEADS